MESAVGRTCPFCQGVIKRGTAVVACSTCGTAHHRECWDEAGGCTTPGCGDDGQTELRSPSKGQQRTSTSTGAVWSLVLGILSLCGGVFVTGVPAIICGHVSLGRIRRSNGTLEGRGIAIGGLATGYVGIILPIIFIVIMGMFADTVRSKIGGASVELGGDSPAVDSATQTSSADWLKSLNKTGASGN